MLNQLKLRLQAIHGWRRWAVWAGLCVPTIAFGLLALYVSLGLQQPFIPQCGGEQLSEGGIYTVDGVYGSSSDALLSCTTDSWFHSQRTLLVAVVAVVAIVLLIAVVSLESLGDDFDDAKLQSDVTECRTSKWRDFMGTMLIVQQKTEGSKLGRKLGLLIPKLNQFYGMEHIDGQYFSVVSALESLVANLPHNEPEGLNEFGRKRRKDNADKFAAQLDVVLDKEIKVCLARILGKAPATTS